MWTPTTSPATLRPDLAAFVEFDTIKFREGMIWDQAAPIVDVALQADNPGKIPAESLLQGMDGTEDRRASGADYGRISAKFENWAYATEEHGLEAVVDERRRRIYQNIIDAQRWTLEAVTIRILGNQEKRVADLIFNTAVWTGSSLATAISTDWTQHTSAVPIDNILAAKLKVRANTGMWPNAVIMDRETFIHCRECDQVVERIQASGAGQPAKASDVTADMLAQVFDVKKVIVAGASRNTAIEGQAPTFGQFWDKDLVMVARVAETGNVDEPCIARTFHWDADGSQVGGTVESYQENRNRGEVLRVRHETDEVVMYTQLGHLLTGALS